MWPGPTVCCGSSCSRGAWPRCSRAVDARPRR
jgi:hypothetical protein